MTFLKKLITIFIFYSLILSLSASASAWWDNDWGFRKPIIINGSTSALTDYQVKVDINWTEDMNTTFDDLRFIYSNDSSGVEVEIPYWIESSNVGVNASVWIKTNLTTENNTVYLYYDNLFVENKSNKSNTYTFLHDFKTNPGLVLWGTTIRNGAFDVTFPTSGYISETTFNYAGSGSWAYAYAGDRDQYTDERLYFNNYNHGESFSFSSSAQGSVSLTLGAMAPGNTYIQRVTYLSGINATMDMLQNDVVKFTSTLNLAGKTYTPNQVYYVSRNDVGGGSVGYDANNDRIWVIGKKDSYTTLYYYDYKLRSYAYPEPYILLIGEKQRPSTINIIHSYFNTSPKSYLGEGQNITLKVNGSFMDIPTITITDSNSTIQINRQPMTNISNTFYYNYTLNGSSGWYNITIDNTAFDNVFYQGDLWQDNWTDADNNIFPFRIELNLSSQENRWFEPVDIPITFLYGANNKSIRLVQSNGTGLLEVPSQIYNLNQTGNDLNSANLVFLTTTGIQNQTYYIYYSKADYTKNYDSDMNLSNTTDIYQIENSYYTTIFNRSYGGLMQYAKDKSGTDKTLAGLEPMDYYPEFRVQYGSTYAIRNYIYPQVTIESGPIFTNYKVSGNMQDPTNPYNLSIKFYSKNPYFLIDKSFTQTVSRYWDYMFGSSMRYKDGLFSEFTYKNSTGDIIINSIASGDNSDYLNLDNGLQWLAVYNNITSDAMADIFLNNTYSVESGHVIDFIDRGDYDFYVRKVISSTLSVPANPVFTSTTARMIYKGLDGYIPVENLYAQLLDPINTSLGTDETYDEEIPNYTTLGNISTDDTKNITCYSYWTDDSYLNYAEINVTGPGILGNNTILYYHPSYSIRNNTDFTNESWLNITLSEINAGLFNCTMRVYDISGKSNTTSTEFTVEDITAPTLENISSSPYTKADLDPNKTIIITVNITEYTKIDTVILYYKSNQTWNSTIMTNTSKSYYTKTYEANFTPDTEANYTYYIYANDTDGNERNSTEINLSVFYDWTWAIEPFDFGTVSGSLETNVTVGNITINNTGDKILTFKLTSDWEDKSKIYFNNTIESDTGLELSVTPHNSTNISLIVETKTTERSDSLNIQLNAINSSAVPTINTTTATIVSHASGPFMFITITEYNSTMTQGDIDLTYIAKVQNKGNETANDSWLAWILPSGWSITSGLQNVSLGNLAVDAVGWNYITVSVSDTAYIGTKTIIATSGTSYSENKTRSLTKEVIVAKKSEIITETITTNSPNVGGDGGGVSPGLSTAQKDQLFQTSETFELVRGKDNNFSIMVENPFGTGNLEDITLDVTGYMSQYIELVPDHLDSMSVGKSHQFMIYLNAPKYFTIGNYWLNFTIKGTNRDITKIGNATTEKITTMVEHRSILLKIHDISRNETEQLIKNSTDILLELDELNINTKKLGYLINTSISALESGDYESARDITEIIKHTHDQITQTVSIINQLTIGLTDIHSKEITTPSTDRILSLVQFALGRGDYETALSRAKEAQMTYALETKGAFNPIYFLKTNKNMISAAIAGILVLITLMVLSLRYWSLNHTIKMLKKEENILIGLMKEVQHECFDNAKMSLEEFGEAMIHYEKKLGKVVSNLIEIETKKDHFLTFKSKVQKLNDERDRLMHLIKQTQKEYLEYGTLETRIYENRLKSFSSRLSEVEEHFALIEARTALSKGNIFSRIFNLRGVSS